MSATFFIQRLQTLFFIFSTFFYVFLLSSQRLLHLCNETRNKYHDSYSSDTHRTINKLINYQRCYYGNSKKLLLVSNNIMTWKHHCTTWTTLVNICTEISVDKYEIVPPIKRRIIWFATNVSSQTADDKIQWVTSLFDLTFAEPICWAKVRSKYLLYPKSEVISLSESRTCKSMV